MRDEIIVTSAGNCSELWWELTHESERVFYLEASMSLASLFAAGIAIGQRHRTVVAFSGDGAFCMNPGTLMVEPTESESKEEMDLFIDAMKSIAEEVEENPQTVLDAPHSTRVSRLDETAAARKPILRWKPSA